MEIQQSLPHPLASQKMGISTVYQEVNLCANLSVAENIYIGREQRGGLGRIDLATMQKNASDLLFRELGIDIDVTKELNFYPVAMQQMIAIARAIDTKCKVLSLMSLHHHYQIKKPNACSRS